MKWKDVPGWEEFYQVSNAGLVRSKNRKIKVKNPWGKIAERNYMGRVLKPGVSSNGYFVLRFTSPAKIKSLTVHSLVALAFLGTCPKGKEVLHKNGNKEDNRLVNLRYGTRKENAQDKFRHGYKTPTGFASPNSKLNIAQVRWVKRNADNLSARAMGRKLKVCHHTISRVLKGLSYIK